MIMRPELISSVSQVLSQRIQNDRERKEEIRFFRLVKQDGRQIYIHIRQSYMDMYVDKSVRYLIRCLIRYLSNLNRILKLSKFDQTFDVVMDSLHVTPNVGVMLKSYCSFILMIHMLACVWWFWKVLSQSKVKYILGFTYSLFESTFPFSMLLMNCTMNPYAGRDHCFSG